MLFFQFCSSHQSVIRILFFVFEFEIAVKRSITTTAMFPKKKTYDGMFRYYRDTT